MASNGRLAPWLGVLSMAAMSVGGWSYLFMRHPPFPDGQFAWDEGNPKSKVDHPFNHAFETSRELAFGPGKFGDPSIAGSYPAAPAPPAVAIELPKPSVGDFASLPVSNPEPAFGISGESIRGHDREAALAEQRTPANPTEESAGMLQSETSQSSAAFAMAMDDTSEVLARAHEFLSTDHSNFSTAPPEITIDMTSEQQLVPEADSEAPAELTPAPEAVVPDMQVTSATAELAAT